MGAALGGQNMQAQAAMGAGVSPGMIAAMQRANSAKAYGTLGRAVTQARISDVANKAGIYGQIGGLGAQQGNLGLGMAQLTGNLASGAERANLYANTQWGMGKASNLSNAYQTNVANKANARAGFASGIFDTVTSIFAPKLSEGFKGLFNNPSQAANTGNGLSGTGGYSGFGLDMIGGGTGGGLGAYNGFSLDSIDYAALLAG